MTDRWDGKTTAPLLDALEIGKRQYLPDLRVAAAEEATGTSYPETEESTRRFLGRRVPRQTTWGFVREIAHRCKRAWARWGGGLRSMVLLLLIRKTRPAIYRSAIARYMRSVSGGGVR